MGGWMDGDDYLKPTFCTLRYMIVLKDLLSTSSKYRINNCLFTEGDHVVLSSALFLFYFPVESAFRR
jgi:hypothetical protein